MQHLFMLLPVSYAGVASIATHWVFLPCFPCSWSLSFTYWFCLHWWIVSGLAFHFPSFWWNYAISHLCHLLAEVRYSLSLVCSFSKCVWFFFVTNTIKLSPARTSANPCWFPENIPETSSSSRDWLRFQLRRNMFRRWANVTGPMEISF